MRRFGKTSQNSLLRKEIGAVARASCQVGAQRHGRRLAPGAASGSSLCGRSRGPRPRWAGPVLLLHHPCLLSACLPPSAFPKTPIIRINKPWSRDIEIMRFAPVRAWGKASTSVSSYGIFSSAGPVLTAALPWPDSEMFACPAGYLLLLVPLPGGHNVARLFAGWVSSAIGKSIFGRHSGRAGKGVLASPQPFCSGFSVYLGNPTKPHGWHHRRLGYNSFCEATAEPREDFHP